MLRSVELNGFKSFGKKSELVFTSKVSAIVGPNGSGKSNVAEALRFVLGEQSMKSLRSRKGEDLIWGGSHALPRMNRASVKVVFDNATRRLDVDFTEVVLERIVFRDGQNEYLMNGTQVRLKDVVRLLAGANIGGSGYQIISQGEADRILNASPRERREMVEDALGLKLYQHKKAESERKLETTEENIEKVESLRRELAPHLKFLGKQVEKIEKAKEMKDELAVRLADYLAREHAWITTQDTQSKEEEEGIRVELGTVAEQIRVAEGMRVREEGGAENQKEMESLHHQLIVVRRAHEELARELGRAEGALEASRHHPAPENSIPRADAVVFAEAVAQDIEQAIAAESNDALRNALHHARETVRHFIARTNRGDGGDPQAERAALTRVHELSGQMQVAQERESELERALMDVRTRMAHEREAHHEAERALLSFSGRKRELEGSLQRCMHKRSDGVAAREAFEAEVREGIALVGAAVHAWDKQEMPEGALSEDRSMQSERRRALERLKIKIEEYGGGGTGNEVVKEYNQTRDRDEFLARELADLSQSSINLRTIIEQLDAQMDERFTEGLVHINQALQTFFEKLFSGGSARLELEKPIREREVLAEELGEEVVAEATSDEDVVAGLTVAVQLPRKKVRGLEVLSGGERALTSIAMIFAMSQVNPPPFLILDETDAALDEANSKRYADMITILSNRSQLIIITHNRATMSAAGELYGVTMGSDGVSRLLSVKLEEAERVAK
ncbi:MAG: AAA family ATPase [Patescibacteria group bacterium]